MLDGRKTRNVIVLLSLILPLTAISQDKFNRFIHDSNMFNGISMRNLTPGKTGGRIVDVAINPLNQNIWLVGVASGGIWKTTNAGTTWKPVFDNQGSFSIGTVIYDHSNPNIAWAGTGENNAQRSVSKGDGVYKSTDGGNSWTNMGLKTSEHIGKIVVHPNNSDIVFVASQGSLWQPGGERGLFKTSDGGKTWENILEINENTGISDVLIDPRDPDIIIATAYQRRRHFAVLVGGGPDGGAFKSVDGGVSWVKLGNGFPQGELGRIGLARSPQKADVLYAIVAGTDKTKGIYRSENNGDDWVKVNDYMVVDAQYYMEIFPDPHQFDKIYIVDVITKVSTDGGRTLKKLNHKFLHVDNHEIEFNLNDPNYLLIAGDGGIFESWDNGDNWRFIDNLPITQFYRVGVDNDFPFYNLYGGTQDNNTIGGPNQTIHRNGIRNSDWFITLGGDGFQTRVDTENADLIYSMFQYAGLVRYDRKNGEQKDIKPIPAINEPPYRWNWDAPLILSSHDNKTLYFAANFLFRSKDRGNSWEKISGDLTRQIDRNKIKVMDRVWGIDAIFKNVWTSPYGSIVSLTESPIKEGLLYVGTDDGLIQVTEDDGLNWRMIQDIPGIPKNAYVSDLFASALDENVVFAVFNNHKNGDYKPYFLKSLDKGRTWINISSNLPKDDYGWTIYQDHLVNTLLFAGTEYGLYFSLDGGKNWIKFKSGIPTIAIRDLEIQKRDDDLVAASFGRGFYILDDLNFLREINGEEQNRACTLFSVRDAYSYVLDNPDGYAYGANFYSSPNPKFGAVFTYYLKERPLALKEQRNQKEKQKVENNEPVLYPDWDDFNKEAREMPPKMVFVIKDKNGKQVASVSQKAKKGISRVSWNLRHSGYNNRQGPLVSPGTYSVSVFQMVNGILKDMKQSQTFQVKTFPESGTLSTTNPEQLEKFQLQVLELYRKINHAKKLVLANISTVESNQMKIINYVSNDSIINRLEKLRQNLYDLRNELVGDILITQNMELTSPSIDERISNIMYDTYNSTSTETDTQTKSFLGASRSFNQWINAYNKLNEDIRYVNKYLSEFGINSNLLDLELR